jgi:hypothetical protein
MNLILKENENTIVFVYGDTSSQEVSDEELLAQMHATALKGGHIDDALRELETEAITYISFVLE